MAGTYCHLAEILPFDRCNTRRESRFCFRKFAVTALNTKDYEDADIISTLLSIDLVNEIACGLC